MSKWTTWMAIFGLVGLIGVGCGGKDETQEEKKDAAAVTPAGNFACTSCGDKAAAGHTCATDAEVCEGCKLNKGSDLCCKVAPEKLAELKKGQRLCMTCGHIAEKGHKCDPSHETCAICNKHVDSILCNCAAAADSGTSEESGS